MIKKQKQIKCFFLKRILKGGPRKRLPLEMPILIFLQKVRKLKLTKNM